MSFHFGAALAFVLVASAFLAVTLLIGRLLRPSAPSAAKSAVYECGETAMGAGWFNFNPRFFVVGLVFLVFEIEIAFTFPVAAVFRRWIAAGDGLRALWEIGLFILVLGLALGYVWVKGDLEWIRPSRRDEQ